MTLYERWCDLRARFKQYIESEDDVLVDGLQGWKIAQELAADVEFESLLDDVPDIFKDFFKFQEQILPVVEGQFVSGRVCLRRL